ncbi:MAG: HAD hydrolase-like protein [Planctomycetota bacterium]
MSALRGIFFDIDDTLYSTTEFARKARRASVERMVELGLKIDAETCLKELEEVIAEFSANYGQHFDKLIARLGPGAVGDLNPAVLVAGAVMAYHATKEQDLAPFPGVAEVFRKLSRTSLVVGVITEGLAVKQAEKLLWLGLHPFVTPGAIFISDQIGISKPNPKLFKRALDTTGLRAAEAMYVGNRATHDVDPPAALGMHTVLFEHGGKYAGQLGGAKPDYVIHGFEELPPILERDFEVVFR